MAYRYNRPQTMPDDVFKNCAEWAYRMDQAVWGEADLPMEEPPFLYDSFRRANPKAIDPVLAVNMQRSRRGALIAMEAQAARATAPAEPDTVSLKAVELMFTAARTLISDSQHQSRQQMQTAVKALTQAARPAHARPGYERRVFNRRANGPPPHRRPLNSIRADRGNDHVRVPHVLFNHDDRANEDAPPPYRRHRRHRRHEEPDLEGPRDLTPHPLDGFLFQGVGADPLGEDQVMRDETPFDFGGLAVPAGPPPADFVNPRASRADTPARTDDSVAGTVTPRPRSPAPTETPEASGSGQVGVPAVPPGLGLEEGLEAPANTEYAGSVTDGLEQLDLGVADQLLNEFLNPEAVAAA